MDDSVVAYLFGPSRKKIRAISTYMSFIVYTSL